MKKKLICILLLLLPFTPKLMAQETMLPTHEWRAGYGDMLYERAAFHSNTNKFNYHYNGHFFAEYQYNVLPWLGTGFKFDWSNVNWESKIGESDVTKKDYFNNFCFIPEVRFTYYRRGIFSMYSGLGVGVLVNSGSELDAFKRKTVAAPVVDLTAFAFTLQWGQNQTRNWFTTVDLGGMISLNGKTEVFMLCSRLMAVSIGYRL